MSLTLAALWSIGLLAAYLLLHEPRLRAFPAPRYAGAVILIIALISRLVPNLLVGAGDNFDMASYDIVGRLVLQGEDAYRATAGENRYPYLPLLLYWMAGAVRAAEITGWDFAALVRILPILADVALAVLIYLLLKARRNPQEGWFAGLLYSMNPVAVFVSAYHGQFDPLASLLMMASGASLRLPAAAGGMLGLGILVKSWPVLAFPSLAANLSTWRRRAIFTLLMGLVPLAGVTLYSWLFQADPVEVLDRALSYNRGVGIWGYTFFLRVLIQQLLDQPGLYSALMSAARLVTLLALAAAWWFRARHLKPYPSLLLVFVAFFAFTHAFAIQYLMWLVPLGLLCSDYRWTRRYTLAAFVYMFAAYFTLILRFQIGDYLPWPAANYFLIIPLGLPAWGVCVAWLVDLWRSRSLTNDGLPGGTTIDTGRKEVTLRTGT